MVSSSVQTLRRFKTILNKGDALEWVRMSAIVVIFFGKNNESIQNNRLLLNTNF